MLSFQHMTRQLWRWWRRIPSSSLIKLFFVFIALLLIGYVIYNTMVVPKYSKVFGSRWIFSDRVITYLTSSGRLDELGRSLQSLFFNFNDRFRYPIIVFHRGDVERYKAHQVLSQYLRGDQLQLIEVHRAEHINEFPPGLDPKELIKDKEMVYGHMFPNYQHMCAFWFRHIYLQSRFIRGGVKYYIRFDTDSIIPTKINYDLFEYMERNNVKYAYRLRWGENDCCGKKMIKFVYQYVKSHGLEKQLSKEFDWLLKLNPESLTENPITLNPSGRQPETYYANFEIVHAPSFR
jgi:hypothetical protein